VKNVIQELVLLPVLHVVTLTANSNESIKNVVMPQETATNSLDAKELPQPDSVDQPPSRDLTPDASSLPVLKVNVTEAVSANKQKCIGCQMKNSEDNNRFFIIS